MDVSEDDPLVEVEEDLAVDSVDEAVDDSLPEVVDVLEDIIPVLVEEVLDVDSVDEAVED